MRQRITIELEGKEQTVAEIFRNIESSLIGEIAAHELDEHSVRKETLPEKASGEIQLPNFLRTGRVVSGQEKGMIEALHGRRVGQDG